MRNFLLFVHVVGLILTTGGIVAQVAIIRSGSDETDPAARAALERLAAGVATKASLVGLLVAAVSGGFLLAQDARLFLAQAWFQAKLAAVAWLAVSLHVDMILSRKVVRARAAGEDEAAIAARKQKALLFRYANAGALATALFYAIAKV